MEKNLRDICTLINDTVSNRVAVFNAEGAKFADEAVRSAFFDILGDDKLTYQNWSNK